MRTKPQVRVDIDATDRELVALFVKRFALSKEMKGVKKANWDAILDEDRWQQVLDKVREEFQLHWITSNFWDEVWEIIHQHSVRIQEKQ